MRKVFLTAFGLCASLALIAQTQQKKDSMHVVLEEVTVSSVRAHDKSAVSYTDVTAKEINQRNYGQDIPYLLSLTPSFVATSDAGTGIGYTGFRIRGTDANRVNVTVNGIPLNDSESHTVFFVNMPDFASSLSSVQVQRGVGTSTNGSAAFGASINMSTDKLNPTPYAELSTIFGSFYTNKNMLKAGTGLINDHWAFDARLSNVSSDGYIDRAWVDMKSYYFSGGYYGESTTLKFVTFGGNEQTYQAWNGVSSENLDSLRTYNEIGEYVDDDGKTQFYDNQTDNYTQTHYQLHWLQQLSSTLNLNVAAHYTRGKGYYEDYKEERDYAEYGLQPATVDGVTLTETDLVRQKWLDNHYYGLTWALNLNQSRFNATLGGALSRYDGDHFGKVKWVRNAQGLDIGKDWYRNNGVKDEANIYAKATAEVMSGLFFNVDLQYRYILHKMAGTDDKYDEDAAAMRDITQEHPFHFFNPKFGLTYQLNKQNDFYASFSVANREPNRNNYTEAGPDEKPVSERLYDTEIGYRFRSPRVSLGANLYYMKYKDQLILTGKISEIGEFLTSNIPDSYRRGIELMASVKIIDQLRWDGNVTLSQNRILNYVEQDVEAYDANWEWIGKQNNDLGTTDIAYSPQVVANSIFTLTLGAFETALTSSYVGKQYIDNTSSDDRSLPAYFVNSLQARYTLELPKMKSIELQFQVNNLLNHQYESNGYVWYSYYLDGQRVNDLRFFPQAGINLLGGVTFRF